ncbi:TetR/AcrR family transcriptional regulator [Actinomadura flavalba]|uniref:TetR/AcrR family transcriptional regulator n=1 Tax=Actinomadura flavalba TaxID=1120938 RepID=UPI000368EF40|nr:TetR/AcrR family transcriptional regulator [Actinomadura flavalba]
MRADAQRNRARITSTALALFAEHGPGVPMDEIARAAGLGVGTLYRHFPDRAALVEEIALTALRETHEVVRGLLANPPADPFDAVTAFARYGADAPFALVKSLSESSPAPAERATLQTEVNALLTTLMERARATGALRPDITPHDAVAVLSHAVCRPGAHPDDPYIRVTLAGLRP